LEEAIEQENEDFVQDQMAKQKMIMKDQDQDLEKLSHTVGTLKGMSATIGNELQEQEG
jgi:hypothetical protein